MKIRILRSLSITTAVLGLTFSASVFAASSALVQIPSEGNGNCNDYAINSIESIGGNVSGTTGTLYSSDGKQQANYTLSSNGAVFEFSDSTAKISYAILKSQRNVRVFYYEAAGVFEDAHMTIPGTNKAIDKVSLCYGLAEDGEPEQPFSLPTCQDLDQDLLDQTGITCPPETSERVLISLDPDKPDWNPTICTCNVTFNSCNPEARLGDVDYCPSGDSLKAIPTGILAGNDGTWVCTTVGGTRTCYSR